MTSETVQSLVHAVVPPGAKGSDAGNPAQIGVDEQLAARISAVSRRRERALGDGNASSDEETEGWITTYMDLITLLLAFFIVMLALANFVAPLPVAGVDGEDQNLVATTAPRDNAAVTRLAQLAVALRGAVDSSLIDNNAVTITAADDAVIIDISGPVMFEPGANQLTETGYAVIDGLTLQLAIGKIFTGRQPFITVEGHTDNRPFSSAVLASNWELSAARASDVVRRMIDLGIDAPRLRAVGYADLHPRTTNETPQGRALNRRVSLVIHESGVSPRAAGQF
ncbi:MAG: OmpA family protein [Proteobacteria bacterium]|nr:OmpA family protein [Pseudomonadota bacterium]MDA1057766.1 OmpA family protein [Pseudomonadota bacterium]